MRVAATVGILTLVVVFGGCQGVPLDPVDAFAADSVEIAFSKAGYPVVIEYHIPVSQVPDVVKAAMDALHPGGKFTGAEKETVGGMTYYELARVVGGMEVEAMFYPNGALYQEEIQVPEGRVAAAVRTTARNAVPGAEVTCWEEIYNQQRILYEYHVKMTKDGIRYKVIVALDGTLSAVLREVPAEIEVQKM